MSLYIAKGYDSLVPNIKVAKLLNARAEVMVDQTIYKTIIPRNIRLAEAPSYGMPINKYDPKSAGADSYMRLADEVMEKE